MNGISFLLDKGMVQGLQRLGYDAVVQKGAGL